MTARVDPKVDARRKAATRATIIRIAELTAKMATGRRKADAIAHLARLRSEGAAS